MKKIVILLSAFIAFSTICKAQNQPIKVSEKIGLGKETYYITDKESKTKHGLYQYSYGKYALINGQFNNGQKHGSWHFKLGKYFFINTYYNNGERDSIWTYYNYEKLISEVRYKNGKRSGNAIGYGKNGEKLSVVPYKEGKIDGVKYVFYENGKTKYEINYRNDTIDGDLKYYDINGKIILHLIYKNDYPYSLEYSEMPDSIKYFSGNLKNGNGSIQIFSKNTKTDSLFLISEHTYKDGLLDGLSKEYGLNGKLQFTGNFKEGYMVGKWDFYNPYNPKVHSSKSYDLDYHVKKDSTDLYPVKLTNISFFKEVLPKFCDNKKDAYRVFIANTMKYPEEALKYYIQGKVFVQFVINETGKVINVKPLNKTVEILEKEAVRVIEASPNWIPGFLDYIPTNTSFTFPITFIMN